MRSVPLEASTLETFDAVVVVTDHTGVDYELVARHARLVVDTRGVLRGQRENVLSA
jgi:UDP-N-acetyl-D-glucosamine dehydrogenase